MEHTIDRNRPLGESFRESALRSYEAGLRGNGEEARAALAAMAARLRQAGADAPALDGAYWLWACGEYARIAGSLADGDDAELVAACVDAIAAAWHEPDRHWMQGGERGLFLGNLALHYAALRFAGETIRSGEAQRVGKQIREMTFASFMNGTHFVSRRGSDIVAPDIVAAAVPFGLVSAGDLALVAAIGRLAVDRLAGDDAALMSWYYSESGQLARARQLLEQAEEGSLLRTIAALQLAGRTGGSAEAAGVAFGHEPVGGECPYMFGLNERSPRTVTIGRPVTIRTFAEPFDPEMRVSLEYAAGDGELRQAAMTAVRTPEGEAYW